MRNTVFLILFVGAFYALETTNIQIPREILSYFPKGTSSELKDHALEMVIFCAAFVIYFLPTILAIFEGKTRLIDTFMFNLLLGWTLLGWFFCLFFVGSSPTRREKAIARAQARQQ